MIPPEVRVEIRCLPESAVPSPPDPTALRPTACQRSGQDLSAFQLLATKRSNPAGALTCVCPISRSQFLPWDTGEASFPDLGTYPVCVLSLTSHVPQCDMLASRSAGPAQSPCVFWVKVFVLVSQGVEFIGRGSPGHRMPGRLKLAGVQQACCRSCQILRDRRMRR